MMLLSSNGRSPDTIDFALIRDTVSLESVIAARLDPPIGGRYVCPFHQDHNPSLAINPDRKHWKCWACGAKGDVVDFVSMYDRIDKRESANFLMGETPATRPRKPPPKPAPKPEPSPVWHDNDWQAVVNEVIEKAEACLWSSEGRDARALLKSRCFQDDTIRRFHLGFVPARYQTRRVPLLNRGIDVRRGIVVPWIATGSDYADAKPRWVGCNVRQLHQDIFALGPMRTSNVLMVNIFASANADMHIRSRTSRRAKAIDPP